MGSLDETLSGSAIGGILDSLSSTPALEDKNGALGGGKDCGPIKIPDPLNPPCCLVWRLEFLLLPPTPLPDRLKCMGNEPTIMSSPPMESASPRASDRADTLLVRLLRLRLSLLEEVEEEHTESSSSQSFPLTEGPGFMAIGSDAWIGIGVEDEEVDDDGIMDNDKMAILRVLGCLDIIIYYHSVPTQ
mmetsp:Transcript_6887/g.14152  ORF Transcript_6887/g.14152 Transcript_6887/m.14152 type:complete len:188 (+) Transcript_6887:987-1550(+)